MGSQETPAPRSTTAIMKLIASTPSGAAPTSPIPADGSATPSSSTTHSSPVPAAKSVSRGLSNGAVAGIAIGVFLAGVLVAAIVFSLLLRRQKQRHSQSLDRHRPPRNVPGTSGEKGPLVVASALTSSVDELIPQPVADDEITGELSRIRDNIKNHARTYYHSAAITSSSIDASGLQNLATMTGVSTATLAAALASPTTRQGALRLVLSWTVLSKCTGERHPSLLSPELSRFATSIQGVNENEATSRLYSKWKTITGALHQQRFGNNAPDPSRVETFKSIITELDQVLVPFVQGSVDGDQRRKNLDMILTRAANFAFLLFSQPGSFRFDFASVHGGLVAFPALVQIIGDQGQVLRSARVLLDKEVAV